MTSVLFSPSALMSSSNYPPHQHTRAESSASAPFSPGRTRSPTSPSSIPRSSSSTPTGNRDDATSATFIDYGTPSCPADVDFAMYNTTFRVHRKVIEKSAPLFISTFTHGSRLFATAPNDCPYNIDVEFQTDERTGRPVLVFLSSFLKDWQTGRPILPLKNVIPIRTLPSSFNRPVDDDDNSTNSHTPRAAPSETPLWPVAEYKSYLTQLFNACYNHRPKKFTTILQYARAVELAAGLHFLPGLCASFRQIAADSGLAALVFQHPAEALVAGYRVRNERIYREAFIHVVGLFPCADYDARRAFLAALDGLPEAARDSVEREAMRLRAELDRLMRGMFCCATITRTNPPNRRMVINEVMNLPTLLPAADEARHGKEGAFVRSLREHWNIPSSAYPTLQSLMANNSMHTLMRFDHLTCAILDDEDIPW